jgi:DNA-binding GntR family transcriptional regulator
MKLAREYGLGRYTVRAALRMLASEGLVEHDRNRGARVRRPTVRDVGDLFFVRKALEIAAGQRIIELGLDVGQVERSVDLVEDLARSEARAPGDAHARARTLDADLDFHRSIVEAARSTRLLAVYDTMMVEYRLVVAYAEIAGLPPVVGEHRSIFGKLAGGLIKEYESAIEEHLQRYFDMVRDTLGSDDGNESGRERHTEVLRR